MSTNELAISFLGLVAGYFLVSGFLDRKPGRSGKPDATTTRDSAGSARADPRPQPPPALDETPLYWPDVLGVSPLASREEIALAYKRRISEYHPDKVAGMGAEIRELAERRSKEINAAYDAALKQSG